MKTILLILSLIVTTLSFSQKFKTETTLQSDGSITKTVSIAPDMLGAGVGLRAVVSDVDTVFYMFYKDQKYKTLTSYEVVGPLTKEDVIKIIDITHKVKDKVVDNAKHSSVLVSRDIIGQIEFRGPVGYSYINVNTIEKGFNTFTNSK